MAYLTKEETAALVDKAENLRLEIVNYSTGGYPFVSQFTLPKADACEFEVLGPYTRNHSPYGVTISQTEETSVRDTKNVVHTIPADASYDKDILILKSVEVLRTVGKDSWYVTSNPDGYGRFETYEKALEKAYAVLQAERTGCIVESELGYSMRLGAMALHEANRS